MSLNDPRDEVNPLEFAYLADPVADTDTAAAPAAAEPEPAAAQRTDGPAATTQVTAPPDTGSKTAEAEATAAAPSETEAAPAPPADTQPSGAANTGVRTVTYALRWAKAAAVIAAVIAGAWWVDGHGIPYAAPTLEEQRDRAAEAPLARNAMPPNSSQALAHADQQAARRHYRAHGTYRGFTAAGARVATSDQLLVASRLDEENRCWIYAMRGARPTQLATDASGIACTDAEIAATQATLDAGDRQTGRAAIARAEAGFEHAARTAASYAGGVWSAGEPSLRGLTGEIGDGVTVTGNHGSWLEAVYRDGDICRRAVISVDGTVGDLAGC